MALRSTDQKTLDTAAKFRNSVKEKIIKARPDLAEKTRRLNEFTDIVTLTKFVEGNFDRKGATVRYTDNDIIAVKEYEMSLKKPGFLNNAISMAAYVLSFGAVKDKPPVLVACVQRAPGLTIDEDGPISITFKDPSASEFAPQFISFNRAPNYDVNCDVTNELKQIIPAKMSAEKLACTL